MVKYAYRSWNVVEDFNISATNVESDGLELSPRLGSRAASAKTEIAFSLIFCNTEIEGIGSSSLPSPLEALPVG